ncbi:MAG: hypothetical protein ABFS45_12080 [Pseudomonadota bacterium]
MKWIDIPELSKYPSASEIHNLLDGTFNFGNCSVNLPSGEQPLYKNMSLGELQSLRCCIYRDKNIEEINDWLEATIRFCEVNMWRLERRMVEVWGRRVAATLTVLTTACLLEAGIVSGDFRFVNTVLKLRNSSFFPSPRHFRGKMNHTLELAKVIIEISDRLVDQCQVA